MDQSCSTICFAVCRTKMTRLTRRRKHSSVFIKIEQSSMRTKDFRHGSMPSRRISLKTVIAFALVIRTCRSTPRARRPDTSFGMCCQRKLFRPAKTLRRPNVRRKCVAQSPAYPKSFASLSFWRNMNDVRTRKLERFLAVRQRLWRRGSIGRGDNSESVWQACSDASRITAFQQQFEKVLEL